MIVVDTNLLAYLHIQGTQTRLAEQVLLRDSDWNAPLLWRSEFRNVLIGCVRRGQMSLSTAGQLTASAEQQMHGKEFSVPSLDVLREADGSGCSAYDCEFVVLAEQLDVRLLTTDRKVLAAFPKTARSPAQFLAGK